MAGKTSTTTASSLDSVNSERARSRSLLSPPPSNSGKSTYLKQVALITILSHCGSYVPASEASIPIRDQICTRIGSADDQEHNISSFLMEMKETAQICNNTTERSLFLLDELGRATSNEDGVAIAWAVSEFLLTKRAMTFFVTHYPQISKLAEVYPNVQNQHLGSQITMNGEASSIRYTHKIMPGPCLSASDYGVEMAVSCGWPDDAVRNARLIRQVVKERMPGEDLCYSEQSKQQVDEIANTRRKAHGILCDIGKHLAALKDSDGRLSKESKKRYLQNLRERLVPTNDETLVRMIRNLLLDEGDDLPTISFTGAKVACKAVDRKAASCPSGLDNASEEASDKATHQHSFNIYLDSSSSSSSSEDESDEEVPIQKPIAKRKPNDAAAAPRGERNTSSPAKESELVAQKPALPSAAMAEPKDNLLPNQEVPAATAAAHTSTTHDAKLADGLSEGNAPTDQADEKAPKPVKKTLSPKKTSADYRSRRPRSQSESSSSSSSSSSTSGSSSSSSSSDSSSSGSSSDSSTK